MLFDVATYIQLMINVISTLYAGLVHFMDMGFVFCLEKDSLTPREKSQRYRDRHKYGDGRKEAERFRSMTRRACQTKEENAGTYKNASAYYRDRSRGHAIKCVALPKRVA